jgi:hypothetical protein
MTGIPDVPGDVRRWRVPPYQPAVLLLVVCAAAAVNLYGHPSGQLRFVTIAFGGASLATAVAWLRMSLYVDQLGMEVRRVSGSVGLPWDSIERIEVVAVAGGMTIRLTQHDGSLVDVPPSLLVPSKPTSKPRALARINAVVYDLETRRKRAI